MTTAATDARTFMAAMVSYMAVVNTEKDFWNVSTARTTPICPLLEVPVEERFTLMCRLVEQNAVGEAFTRGDNTTDEDNANDVMHVDAPTSLEPVLRLCLRLHASMCENGVVVYATPDGRVDRYGSLKSLDFACGVTAVGDAANAPRRSTVDYLHRRLINEFIRYPTDVWRERLKREKDDFVVPDDTAALFSHLEIVGFHIQYQLRDHARVARLLEIAARSVRKVYAGADIGFVSSQEEAHLEASLAWMRALCSVVEQPQHKLEYLHLTMNKLPHGGDLFLVPVFRAVKSLHLNVDSEYSLLRVMEPTWTKASDPITAPPLDNIVEFGCRTSWSGSGFATIFPLLPNVTSVALRRGWIDSGEEFTLTLPPTVTKLCFYNRQLQLSTLAQMLSGYTRLETLELPDVDLVEGPTAVDPTLLSTSNIRHLVFSGYRTTSDGICATVGLFPRLQHVDIAQKGVRGNSKLIAYLRSHPTIKKVTASTLGGKLASSSP